MRVLFAASEAYPFASTGGLAGVIGSLPGALAEAGHDVSLVIPFYRDLDVRAGFRWKEGGYATVAGETFGLARAEAPAGDVKVYMVSRDEYFDRPGIYGPDPGSAYDDNAARFSFFCRAVASLCETLPGVPDVVHCHDWQTGPVGAWLRNSIRPAVVFTVHNLGYQGVFPAGEYGLTLLPPSLFSTEGLEYHGGFSFLKAGLVFADRITTVSPTYAKEILTPERGEGMDGVLRDRAGRLTGILNGIDFDSYDPGGDPFIAVPFERGGTAPRAKCREDLMRRSGIARTGPLAGMVSRLTEQKGLDLLLPAMGKLIEDGMNFVLLGAGEERYMRALKELSRKHREAVSLFFGYDDAMARRIFAGADLVLMPSIYEPCGLAQMMGMRYGAVPLVRRTGGLADTVTDVEDGGFGFVMEGTGPEDLVGCARRAMAMYRDRRRWSWLVRKCMAQDNSWSGRAGRYEEVYRQAVKARRER